METMNPKNPDNGAEVNKSGWAVECWNGGNSWVLAQDTMGNTFSGVDIDRAHMIAFNYQINGRGDIRCRHLASGYVFPAAQRTIWPVD